MNKPALSAIGNILDAGKSQNRVPQMPQKTTQKTTQKPVPKPDQKPLRKLTGKSAMTPAAKAHTSPAVG